MTNHYNFNQVINRHGTDSIKWGLFDEDVLPLWVADMDFESPQEVIDAIVARSRHGIFGYPKTPEKLKDTIKARLARLYQWKIETDWIVFTPGVVTGLNMFCHAVRGKTTQVLVQTPVYPPILNAPVNAGLQRIDSALIEDESGYHRMDLNSMEEAFKSGVRAMILCNPHNPVGRVFTREELHDLVELCHRYQVILCSDEIHAELVFEGHEHTPINQLAPELNERIVTLLAPSKTFNIAGLGCAVAIIPDAALRKDFECKAEGLVPHVNLMGYTAAQAAYEFGDEWLSQLIPYLQDNRDHFITSVEQKLPGIKVFRPEGTYLVWLDCTNLHLQMDPARFFLEKAKVGLNRGSEFGVAGENYVRLNFACPRMILDEAITRMEHAISNLHE